MPLKLRPTGLGHGVYKDVPNYGVFCGEWCIGRIYETRTGPADLRWFWALHAAQQAAGTTHRQPRGDAGARPRPSSRRAGSSGRRGRGWRKSPEQEARSNGIKRRVVRLVRHSMVSNRDGKPKKRAPMTPINPADEFLKHAAECQQMAKATRNPANKGTWNWMAERWLQCAERAKNQKVATRARTPIRRQVEVSSAHY